jgi:hypothetical protein
VTPRDLVLALVGVGVGFAIGEGFGRLRQRVITALADIGRRNNLVRKAARDVWTLVKYGVLVIAAAGVVVAVVAATVRSSR